MQLYLLYSDFDCDAALIPAKMCNGSDDIDFYVCITGGMSIFMMIVCNAWCTISIFVMMMIILLTLSTYCA